MTLPTPPQRLDPAVAPLFEPFRLGPLELRNRIVMAPMTRNFSPGGIPGPNVAAYYRRRAEGGVGLIITEGTWIGHPSAGNSPLVPRFHGADALAGWADVCRQVHEAGARIIPQLWHVGAPRKTDGEQIEAHHVGPSGLNRAGIRTGRCMTQADIDTIGAAYVDAAAAAAELSFDGVELHGAHGYLLDQFFWSDTNQRTDAYGGDIARRSRFAADVVRAIRRRVGANFPIVMRFSQWKMQDYAARPWPTAGDLEAFLAPLVDAGVDMFHCSQRYYWQPEFPGSELNLAGWTRKITGRPAIAVGCVTLNVEAMATVFRGEQAELRGMADLVERMRRAEFDLIAVGRALIANPDWPIKVAAGRSAELQRFAAQELATLV